MGRHLSYCGLSNRPLEWHRFSQFQALSRFEASRKNRVHEQRSVVSAFLFQSSYLKNGPIRTEKLKLLFWSEMWSLKSYVSSISFLGGRDTSGIFFRKFFFAPMSFFIACISWEFFPENLRLFWQGEKSWRGRQKGKKSIAIRRFVVSEIVPQLVTLENGSKAEKAHPRVLTHVNYAKNRTQPISRSTWVLFWFPFHPPLLFRTQFAENRKHWKFFFQRREDQCNWVQFRVFVGQVERNRDGFLKKQFRNLRILVAAEIWERKI